MSDRHRHYRRDSDDDEEVRSKRQRSDNEEQMDKLENLIAQLGNTSGPDQHESLQNNLHGLAAVLDSDIANFRTRIMTVLLKCAQDRPDKLSIYSTLIGLLNLKNHAFVGDLIERLIRRLREQLNSGKDYWNSIGDCLCFLAELTNSCVIAPASLLQLYNSFVSVTLEDGIPQCRSDCFVMCVLASLPRSANSIAKQKRKELDELVQRVGNYRSRRSTAHVPTLQVLNNSEQLDSLDSLWHQLLSMQRNSWQEKCMVKFEALQPLLTGAGESSYHTLPAIAPPPHEDANRYPTPTVVFRVFDYVDVPEDVPALPGERSIERYLIEQHLLRVLDASIGERRDCAKALLNCKFGVKVPLAYIIGELVLGKILQLPRPQHLQLAYSSLLIELCKEDSETMPNVVAQAVFNLYDKLDCMNPLCLDRLAKWFGYHLSQFQYKWSWQDWAEDAVLPPLESKRIFLRETAQILVRFSYYEDVQKLLRDSDDRYANLLPSRPPECVYKFAESASSTSNDEAGQDEASLETAAVARRLLERIRRRCLPEEAIEILKQLPSVDDATKEELEIDAFFSTLLNLASKSFSHSFAALAKFDILCKALVPKDNRAAQLKLLEVLFRCWKYHEQMLVVLVDKMVKVQLLQCVHVFEFLLGDDRLPAVELSKFYTWDIVESTLGKMCRHSLRLKEAADSSWRQFEALAAGSKSRRRQRQARDESKRRQRRERDGGGGGGGDEDEEMDDDGVDEEEAEQGEQRQRAAEDDGEGETPATSSTAEEAERESKRQEAVKKREDSDQCERSLAELIRSLVIGCFGLVDKLGPSGLGRIVADRTLSVAVLHHDSVSRHLVRLRPELSRSCATPEANRMMDEFFFKFFALTD